MQKKNKAKRGHWIWVCLIPAALLVWWPLWFLCAGALMPEEELELTVGPALGLHNGFAAWHILPTWPTLERQLYTNAYDASFGLYGEGANLMDKWGYKVVTDGSDSVPFIEDHYTLYNVSFDEFSERIHSIFTDNCLTSTDYAIKFKNYNGRVAVHFSLHNEMVAGMTIYVQEQYPDTYRLVKNTSEEVEFTLISHYDRDGSVENPLEVYIIEYPIRMVKTDYGWRIDDFHTSRYG